MLYLASASPRRVQLLRQAGLKPKVLPSKVPESRRPGEGPKAMVLRLAKAKAAQVAQVLAQKSAKKGLVLAADTTVALGSRVLEKPKNAADAIRMLSRLSGRSHTVYTGVAFFELKTGKRSAFVEATKVTFRKLSPKEIRAYVATGEPMDKAGAYGIQGGAAAFVRRIEGDYSNVVGLPLARVIQVLEAFQ